jgi:hypothetical protein
VQDRQDSVGKSPCRRTVSLGDQRHRRRFGRVFRPPSPRLSTLVSSAIVSWALSLHPRLMGPSLSAAVSRPSSLSRRLWAFISEPGLSSAFKPVSGLLKKWDPLRNTKFWQSNKAGNSKPKLFLCCQRHCTGTSGSTSQMIINVETSTHSYTGHS